MDKVRQSPKNIPFGIFNFVTHMFPEMSAIETILRICKRREYFCTPLVLLPMKMYMLFVYCLHFRNHFLTNVIENVVNDCKLNTEGNTRRVFHLRCCCE